MATSTLVRNKVKGDLLARRAKNLDPCRFSYKFQGEGHSGFGLDVVIGGTDLAVDEQKMSVIFPYADGNARDGVGDLLEVGGIDVARHKINSVILFDHAKQVVLPIGMSNPYDGKKYDRSIYLNEIDPMNRTAKVQAYFYQGKGIPGVDRKKDYDHSLFCDQTFDMVCKGLLLGGSIGYQIKSAQQMSPDYSTGVPQGLHLLSVLMLEASLVVLPANMDTVMKTLAMPKVCGKRLSPYLVKSLQAYAPPKRARMFVPGATKTAEVPLDNLPKTKIPPSRWKPGLGAIKDIRAKYSKKLNDPPAKAENPRARYATRANANPSTPGYTGTREDTLGRIQCYSHGHHIPCGRSNYRNVRTKRSSFTPGDIVHPRSTLFVQIDGKPTEEMFAAAGDGLLVTKVYEKIDMIEVKRKDSEKGAYLMPLFQEYSIKDDAEERSRAAKESKVPKAHNKKSLKTTPKEFVGDLNWLKEEEKESEHKKGLKNLRKKYRSIKKLRRRVKRSIPGHGMMHVAHRDLHLVKQRATEKDLAFKYVGGKGKYAKIRLTGHDSAIDDIAKEFGHSLKLD